MNDIRRQVRDLFWGRSSTSTTRENVYIAIRRAKPMTAFVKTKQAHPDSPAWDDARKAWESVEYGGELECRTTGDAINLRQRMYQWRQLSRLEMQRDQKQSSGRLSLYDALVIRLTPGSNVLCVETRTSKIVAVRANPRPPEPERTPEEIRAADERRAYLDSIAASSAPALDAYTKKIEDLGFTLPLPKSCDWDNHNWVGNGLEPPLPPEKTPQWAVGIMQYCTKCPLPWEEFKRQKEAGRHRHAHAGDHQHFHSHAGDPDYEYGAQVRDTPEDTARREGPPKSDL